MAFKSVEEFNDNRYHGLFRLVNDKESADVVFLYRSMKDMLVAQAHYIKSQDYSGYVHCCESGCPACSKGIRIQTKLFIPLYNVDKKEIQFWDRTIKFEPQLEKDVFNRFPNPSEFIFRITRNGIPNDINTTYSIEPVFNNTIGTYDEILAKCQTTLPDGYSAVIRDINAAELSKMLQNAGSDSGSNLPDYTPIPRSGYQSSIPTPIEISSDGDEVENISENVIVHFDSPKAAEEAPSPNLDNTEADSGDLPDPIF